MPKVFYHEGERRLIINGMAFPAEPVQAKRALEAFGLEIGQELDLYTGEVRRVGEAMPLGIMPGAVITEKKIHSIIDKDEEKEEG